jgi:N-acetylglutamate synthase-like GNAT family acetyltransferase
MTATALASLRPSLEGTTDSLVMRSATRADAPQIHALVLRHRESGHLLPRTEAEIAGRAERFLVIQDDGGIVGCAELAPLSAAVAEVRSLVLDEHLRGLGLGRLLVEQLTREARLGGFRTVCAFTHEPGYFARLGFSLVPHAWLPEKIAVDCAGCALFRRCGQSAMRLQLPATAAART